MALPVIALLAVGAVAVVAMSGKKGKGGFRVLDGQCRVITREVNTEEQFHQIVERLLPVIFAAYENVTGVDPRPYEQGYSDPEQGARAYYQAVLGEAPGDIRRNSDFAQAVATEMLKLTATPACIRKMGIPDDFGAEDNVFGADWTEWGDPGDPGRLNMGDVVEYLTELINSMLTDISRYGYDVGFGFSLAPGARLPTVAESIAERLAA